uniref:LAGLIDADG homing endonuclease n=1 Tax=Romanomermis culicivorax TaxID=13658 RepID=A0A915J6C6_ROMCU
MDFEQTTVSGTLQLFGFGTLITETNGGSATVTTYNTKANTSEFFKLTIEYLKPFLSPKLSYDITDRCSGSKILTLVNILEYLKFYR